MRTLIIILLSSFWYENENKKFAAFVWLYLEFCTSCANIWINLYKCWKLTSVLLSNTWQKGDDNFATGVKAIFILSPKISLPHALPKMHLFDISNSLLFCSKIKHSSYQIFRRLGIVSHLLNQQKQIMIKTHAAWTKEKILAFAALRFFEIL